MSQLQKWIALACLMTLTVTGVTKITEAHGGDPNRIHTCVLQMSLVNPDTGFNPAVSLPVKGSMRLVNPGDECNSNEAPFDWLAMPAN